MKSILKDFIKQKLENSEEPELHEILDIFNEYSFRKGTILKKRDTINKKLGFLISGDIRAGIYSENGDEVTFRVLKKNSFIVDIISVRSKQPTPISFECLNDVEILMTPVVKFQKLLKTNFALNYVIREIIEDNFVALRKHQLTFLTGSSKERYQFILETYPNLIKNFPLKYVANMIGVTPTQLSRIRKDK